MPIYIIYFLDLQKDVESVDGYVVYIIIYKKYMIVKGLKVWKKVKRPNIIVEI